MSERSGDGLTPGDPLDGGEQRPSGDPLWSSDRPAAPEAPEAPGYTSPPPPGAGGPVRPAAIAPGGPVAGRYVLSGWWRRVGAQVIDGLIVSVGAGILLIAITAPFS